MNGDGSRELFERLSSIEAKDAAVEIRAMLGQPETGQLDFTCKKDKATACIHPDDKRGFAKAVSGFSNSDGGLLIWGVEAKRKKNDAETPDVVTGFHPISNVEAFATTLNSLVCHATTPVAYGVESTPIMENEINKAGFCLTFVPAGDNPPYRANLEGLREYYKRAASSFYPMEPYDIRDVIFRFKYPKLEIEIEPGEDAINEPYIHTLTVRLTNKGPVSLRSFRFELMVPKVFDWTPKLVNPIYKEINGMHYAVYTIKSVVGFMPTHKSEWRREPVYPEETITLFGAKKYKANLTDDYEALSNAQLRWALFGDDMPALSGARSMADFLK